MTDVARIVLGLSGLAAAALALLPAFVAALIALFDVSAHAVLGTSGSILGFAGNLGFGGGPGTGGGLPPYARIDVHPWLAAAISLARGVPPIGMVVAAVRPARFRSGIGRVVLFLLVLLALISNGLTGAVLSAPGAVAALFV